jgi:hypothetical protein
MSKKKIVFEHYPVRKLPEELREGFDLDAFVTITIEWDESSDPANTREEHPRGEFEAKKFSD